MTMNLLDEALKFGVGFAVGYPTTYLVEKVFNKDYPLLNIIFISAGAGAGELAKELYGKTIEPSYWLGTTAGSVVRSIPTYLKMRTKEKVRMAKEYFSGDLIKTEH